MYSIARQQSINRSHYDTASLLFCLKAQSGNYRTNKIIFVSSLFLTGKCLGFVCIRSNLQLHHSVDSHCMIIRIFCQKYIDKNKECWYRRFPAVTIGIMGQYLKGNQAKYLIYLQTQKLTKILPQ